MVSIPGSIRSQKPKPSLRLIRTMLLTAGLLAGADPSMLTDSFGCSLTSDSRIADCSPRKDIFSTELGAHQSVSGRAFALTVSADGKRLYAGTISGVWRSDNGGVTWHQLTRPQPPEGENVVPGALPV